jgi:hypothetical protein
MHDLAQQIIGTINGRPVYRIAGGDGSGEGQEGSAEGDGGGQGSEGGAGQDAPPEGQEGQEGSAGSEGSTGGAPEAQGAAAGQQPADGDVASLPSWAQKQIRDLRGESAERRTKARDADGRAKQAEEKHQGTLDAIAKALGLKEEEGPPDPAKLTEQLQAEAAEKQTAQVEATAARIELQVFRTAQRLGVDADRLLDSRQFCDAVDKLEAADEAVFTAKVESLIEDHLKKHPTLRAAQAAKAPSGGEFSGGPGGRPGSDQMSIDDFRKQRKERRAGTV